MLVAAPPQVGALFEGVAFPVVAVEGVGLGDFAEVVGVPVGEWFGGVLLPGVGGFVGEEVRAVLVRDTGSEALEEVEAVVGLAVQDAVEAALAAGPEQVVADGFG